MIEQIPADWEYLGEADYFQIYQHKSGIEVFQHAVGGPVVSLDMEIPDTNCVLTAMRFCENEINSEKMEK